MKRLIILLFIGIPFLIEAQNENGEYKNLGPSEFYIQMQTHPNSLVLDVRLFSEYRQERIPGAVLAEKREKLVSVTDSVDKETHIFVYCEDGQRSATVSKILTQELGFTNVYNLEKGLYAWKRKGLPIDDKKLKRNIIRRIFE
jgi:rhodanese-related sulfurtransferase